MSEGFTSFRAAVTSLSMVLEIMHWTEAMGLLTLLNRCKKRRMIRVLGAHLRTKMCFHPELRQIFLSRSQTLQQKRRCAKLHKLNLKGKRSPRPRRWWVRPIYFERKEKGAWYTLIPKLRAHDTEKFYEFFRMTPEAFDRLLKLVRPHLTKYSWREAISPGERLAIALRYYASGDKYTSLSFLFRVSDQAISNIVLEVSAVIWNVLEPIVFETPSQENWLKIAAGFDLLWQFPHCLGAIDGKHIFMKKPAHSGSRNYNFKGRFSMVLMGIADARRKFLYAYVGASGKRGDSDIFNNSPFGKLLNEKALDLPPACHYDGIEEDLPFVFIGDGAFDKKPNLVNTFQRSNGILSAPKRVFNSRFSRARHCIEDAFGLLYKRYEVFDRPFEGTKTTVRSITLACCALHNYHLMDKTSVPPKRIQKRREWYFNHVDEEGNEVIGRYMNEDPEKEASILENLQSSVAHCSNSTGELSGEEIREVLLDYFIDYPVPGQWKKARVC
ncbi:Protein ALP1-like [Frankliniella fusca]|uniref:Protein ALP1-like n=1 Tax=Frankliniella fusca TaxID=407009 RepID=A0AAE1I289_9NEOP|nr:Protein ALP1-like [Frankliniella fusca]